MKFIIAFHIGVLIEFDGDIEFNVDIYDSWIICAFCIIWVLEDVSSIDMPRKEEKEKLRSSWAFKCDVSKVLLGQASFILQYLHSSFLFIFPQSREENEKETLEVQ